MSRPTRSAIARAFTWVEDILYIGLGLVLATSAIALLVHGGLSLAENLRAGSLPVGIISVLDQLLLVLVLVELLYTIQVSFREHALVPEPFLIVGLIAVTRRILVITAEFSDVTDQGGATFRLGMVELAVLTLMILALVASLLMLRRRHPDAVASRE